MQKCNPILLFLCLLLQSVAPLHANDLAKTIPHQSPRLEGYHDPDSIRHRLANAPLDYIEGLWMMTGNQSIVAIERTRDPQIAPRGTIVYAIVMVEPTRKTLKPGTILGYAVPAATPGHYEARIYTTTQAARLRNHHAYTLTMPDDTHISMAPNRSGWKLAVRHTFNFLTRATVYNNTSPQQTADGFIRIFPVTHDTPPIKPVYL